MKQNPLRMSLADVDALLARRGPFTRAWLAARLGVTEGAVNNWSMKGVPPHQARKIRALLDGTALLLDPKAFEACLEIQRRKGLAEQPMSEFVSRFLHEAIQAFMDDKWDF